MEQDNEADWTCLVCTLVNSESSNSCAVCSTKHLVLRSQRAPTKKQKIESNSKPSKVFIYNKVKHNNN